MTDQSVCYPAVSAQPEDLREQIAKKICEMPYPCDQTGVADVDDLQEEADTTADAILELIKGAVKPLGEVTKPTIPPCNLTEKEAAAYDAGQDAATRATVARILAALGVK